MTPSRAKEVLQGMGLDELSSSCLFHRENQIYVEAEGYCCIDAPLSADQLQAIALWMQDPEGVTNA